MSAGEGDSAQGVKGVVEELPRLVGVDALFFCKGFAEIGKLTFYPRKLLKCQLTC